MADDSRYLSEFNFALRVLTYYTRIIAEETSAEPDLGGKLLYAGELDGVGRPVVLAANIAGAASLSVTADEQCQKQAIRDGIVDFVVTTLDEALRILKNEVRKRAPVAVCVAAPASEIEAQMSERGVLPDLLRPSDLPEGEVSNTTSAETRLVVWSVASAPARWMPKLDALALECAHECAGAVRRWLRLAPRYLGRLAQATHLAQADRHFATRFMEGLKQVAEIDVPVSVQVVYAGGVDQFNIGSDSRVPGS